MTRHKVALQEMPTRKMTARKIMQHEITKGARLKGGRYEFNTIRDARGQAARADEEIDARRWHRAEHGNYPRPEAR